MRKFNVTVNGNTYEVEVEEVSADAPASAASAAPAAPAVKAAPAAKAAAAKSAATGAVKVCAPMPGNILKVNVSAGQAVKKGEILCILEAMKMENEILAPNDATVASVNCTKGASVASGDILFSLN